MLKRSGLIIHNELENVPSPIIRQIDDVQAGSGIDPNIRIIHHGRFNNTEIRRSVHFSSIANVNSFAEFYNYVLEILNRVTDAANRLITPKDVIRIEIRGDTLNVST